MLSRAFVIKDRAKDLREELDFVATFDRAMQAFKDASKMPDRKANLFVRLVLQNGRVSDDKRQRHFPELTAEEFDALEEIVQRARSAPAGINQD